jgi:amino acid permease
VVVDRPHEQPLEQVEPAGEVGVEEFHRGLKERHIQMIAIGGAIGVGLFLGSAILGTLMILPRA